MTRSRIVIVGVGAAGAAAATELRRLGFDGELTLVHGEGAAPYNRTTVNKTLLQPHATVEAVRTTVPTDSRTTWVTALADGVDTGSGVVVLDDGRSLQYDALLVATGARPRTLPGRRPGQTVRGGRVTPLRTYADAERVRGILASVATVQGREARVAVAGASLLGSETADALQRLGHEVFLVDAVPSPLMRLLGTVISGWVEAQHRDHLAGRFVAGVDFWQVGRSDVGVGLSNGTELSVDLLIEALGVTPEVDWLRDSPLAVHDGVVVDDRLRTLHAARVFAAGDLARVDGVARIEHWGHALAQGAHAARSIAHVLGLGEDPGPYVPSGTYSTWLYGKVVSVLGSPRQDDQEVALAPPGHGSQVTVYSRDGERVSAAVVLGSGRLTNKLRSLVTAGAMIDEVADVVASTLALARSGG